MEPAAMRREVAAKQEKNAAEMCVARASKVSVAREPKETIAASQVPTAVKLAVVP